MERKQQIIQRTREYFGERLDEILHMVKQDRQELHGWEEPSHLRGVLRRAVREEGTHQELLERKGIYAELFQLQAEGYR